MVSGVGQIYRADNESNLQHKKIASNNGAIKAVSFFAFFLYFIPFKPSIIALHYHGSHRLQQAEEEVGHRTLEGNQMKMKKMETQKINSRKLTRTTITMTAHN